MATTGARPAWRLARAALALVLASPLGCELLLDAKTDPGPHCNFKGRDTSACGLCLARHCQPPIDQCCGDATCQAALDVIDRCSGDADVDACQALHDGTAPVAASVAMCARTSCAVECSGGHSVTNCHASTDSCSCAGAIGGVTSDDVCSDVSIEDGLCCAEVGYPDQGLVCSCDPYGCRATTDGCACGVNAAGSVGLCTGKICCAASPSSCHCGTTACGANETSVIACTPSTVGCDQNRVHVTTCSRMAP